MRPQPERRLVTRPSIGRVPGLLALAADRQALWSGWASARRCPLAGVDGQTPTAFAMLLTERLDELSADLAAGTYRCGPVRFEGADSPQVVANVRDRVADGAIRAAVRSLMDAVSMCSPS